MSLVKAADGGHLAGLGTCGSVHSCNVCAPVIRQDRSVELGDAIEQWQGDDREVFLVTLTAPHHAGMRLAQGIDALMESWRSMMGGGGRDSVRVFLDDQLGWQSSEAVRPWLGVVRAIDITWGESAGWHPHYHCVVFTRRGITARRVRQVLVGAWLRATGSHGVQAVAAACDVRKIKRGGGNAAAVAVYGMKAAWELLRIDLKRQGGGAAPWELLAAAIDGDLDALHLWTEYSLTMKGKRASVWSRQLHAWFFRCASCAGTGLVDGVTCTACKGTGKRPDRTDEERAQGELVERQVLGHVASSDVVALRRIPGACSALMLAIEAGTWRELLDDLGVAYEEGPPPDPQLRLFRDGPFVTAPAARRRRYASARGST